MWENVIRQWPRQEQIKNQEACFLFQWLPGRVLFLGTPTWQPVQVVWGWGLLECFLEPQFNPPVPIFPCGDGVVAGVHMTSLNSDLAEFPESSCNGSCLSCSLWVGCSLCLTCIGRGDYVLWSVSSSCSSTTSSSAWKMSVWNCCNDDKAVCAALMLYKWGFVNDEWGWLVTDLNM